MKDKINITELLLKDLSARLPYGVKASYYGAEEECETWDEIEGITRDGYVDIGQYSLPIERIKPYLFPLSSMTEEQYDEYTDMGYSVTERGWSMANYRQLDWLNKNYFDWRGLIPMGLANDATGLNIY
jgi:hypothetical protein